MNRSGMSEKLFVVPLAICIMQGLLTTMGVMPNELINPGKVLEFSFFTICAINLRPRNYKIAIMMPSISILGLTLILISRLNDVPYFESLRAYKWLFFYTGLLGLSNKSSLNGRLIKRIYIYMLTLLFISYLTEIILHGFSFRPTLFIENNYECAFLIGLFVTNISLLQFDLSRKYLFWNIILLCTIFMSQSRSALFGLILVFGTTAIREKTLRRNILTVILLATSSSMMLYFTLLNRRSSLNNVDRFQFLRLFINDFNNKSLFHQLFGSWIIQPLNPETCIQLRFYSSLQNDEALGSCYSVVLHSFVIRAANDFGIIGSLLIFLCFSRIVLARLRKTAAISYIALFISNSLSVSGINNVYIVLPIMIAMLSNNNGDARDSGNSTSQDNVNSH